jgi:hypothetical protein
LNVTVSRRDLVNPVTFRAGARLALSDDDRIASRFHQHLLQIVGSQASEHSPESGAIGEQESRCAF